MSPGGQPVQPHMDLPEAVEPISWLRRWPLLVRTKRPLLSLARAGHTPREQRLVAEIRLLKRIKNGNDHSDLTSLELAIQRFAPVEANGGVLPLTRTELERLPGIGPYTASAVLAIVLWASRAAPRCEHRPPPGAAPRIILAHRDGSQTHAARARIRLVQSKRSSGRMGGVYFGALVAARRPLCPERPLQTRCAVCQTAASTYFQRVFFKADEGCGR